MKKFTYHNPLMLAYMIFIFICMIWHIICDVTGFNFETWDKIIVAVTIASYFFSLNSMNRSVAQMREKVNLLHFESRDILKKMIEELAVDEAELTEGLKEWREELYTELEVNKAELEKTVHSLLKQRRTVMVVDVLGYLVFFIVLGIDGVSSFLINSTGAFTLMAFLMVLAADYFENIIAAKSEEYNIAIKDSQQKMQQRKDVIGKR